MTYVDMIQEVAWRSTGVNKTLAERTKSCQVKNAIQFLVSAGREWKCLQSDWERKRGPYCPLLSDDGHEFWAMWWCACDISVLRSDSERRLLSSSTGAPRRFMKDREA